MSRSSLPGEEYEVAPADNVKSVPKFSRRAKLAELATNGSNQAFNRNIVNRLWAHMFGRGLVHPLDLHHPDNPPSNPELLRLLAEQFAAMNFDMREFLARDCAERRVPAVVRSAGRICLRCRNKRPTEVAQLAAAARRAGKAAAGIGRGVREGLGSVGSRPKPRCCRWPSELDTARNQVRRGEEESSTKRPKRRPTRHLSCRRRRTLPSPLQQAATAAQEAVKVLPEDKELADAAQKFVARRSSWRRKLPP